MENRLKNQYSNNNLENRLIYNNIYFNLFKNRLNENEILIFIEEIINIDCTLIYPVLNKDLAYNETETETDKIIINITTSYDNHNTGTKGRQNLYNLLYSVFLSHKIKFEITFDIFKNKYLIIEL